MPVMKRDINTRSLDEFVVNGAQPEEPKTPPTIKVSKPKGQTTLRCLGPNQ